MNSSQPDIPALMRDILGSRADEFLIPPPSFLTMKGEFIDLNQEELVLSARFPIQDAFLNPYGFLQGGFTAAAIDNTIGPLSMLAAPPNVTRRLQITYSEPAHPDLEFITVTAHLVKISPPILEFRADVRDRQDKRLARAQATHWILDEEVASE